MSVRSIRNTAVHSPRKKKAEGRKEGRQASKQAGKQAGRQAGRQVQTAVSKYKPKEYESYESCSLQSLGGNVHACYYIPRLNRKPPSQTSPGNARAITLPSFKLLSRHVTYVTVFYPAVPLSLFLFLSLFARVLYL